MTEIDYSNAENEMYTILSTGWVATNVKKPKFEVIKQVPEPNINMCSILCEPAKSQSKVGIGLVAAFIQVHNFHIFIYEGSKSELNYALSQMTRRLVLACQTNKLYNVTNISTDIQELVSEGIIQGTREYFYNLT